MRARPGAIGRLRDRYHAARMRSAFGAVLGDGAARVLDVGCGDGRFLDVMRLAFGPRLETHGIDMDDEAVAFARANGHRVATGTIESAAYPDASFDLVYVSHVIEHLASPRAFLGTCRRLLKPGGAVHIETPNLDCAEARLFRRRYWGGYHFPRHWHLFTPASLSRLAAACGLEVRRISYGLSPVFWNWTVHHVLAARPAMRPVAEAFGVTSIYRNDVWAVARLAAFSAVERASRLLSGGRGSNMAVTLTRPAGAPR
jgi:SAM-dependent methyltransferase